ncbi:MAG: magnesium transporter CorA family protein [Alphaproteobacteria bacterium]|nr:magnesium transporter CorA family protein [Alphaproteobacteria bacterium]
MLTLYHFDQGKLVQTVAGDALSVLPYNTVWLDLLHPTREEEQIVERLLSIAVPTREEMQEIEVSSRLYVDKAGVVMTLPILNKSATDEPESSAVTFILTANRLVTLRYADPAPFGLFVQQIERQPALAATGEQAIMGLLEQVADRLADILESATAGLEKLSREIFRNNGAADGKVDFRDALRRIGVVGDLATKAKDSLLNLNRLTLFLLAQPEIKRDTKIRVETLRRDAHSIDEHATFLSEKVGFILDATLGLINIEQNNIIKIFSVAAVTFLPPTLIASIYGMNFEAMPELKWNLGYPLAVALMVLSAIVPFWYFRRKKWL